MDAAINNIITSVNGVGQAFWNYAAGIFLQSSVLIVFLLAADFLLRKRVRAVFRYCVWMLVFVKLVLPTSFVLPTGIGYWLGDFAPIEYSVVEAAPAVEEPVPVIMAQEQIEPAEAVVFEPSTYETVPVVAGEAAPIEPVTSTVSTDAGPVETELKAISWQGLAFLGWLVGMLVLSVLLVQRAFFVRGLLAQAKEADGKVRDLLCRCRDDVGVRAEVGLRVSDAMSSPTVCGLIRPTILLPRYLVEQLSEKKLRAVLLHECAHIKRWDLWVNLVQTVLQIVYFYNPFLWLANARVRNVREQAVDEMVLVALGGASESYSDVLIDIGEMAFWRPNFSLRLIGVVESKKALAARIKHIASRPIPKTAKLGIVGSVALVLIGAVLLPMARAQYWAQPSQSENPDVVDQPIESMIYWTDPDSRRILRADLDGTSVKEVVSTETALFDVALDLVHEKVYWTEPDARLIKRADLDGSYIEVVAEDLENPACITLDPERHKIYWTDLEGGRIRRANLDGSGIEDLVTTGLSRPEGICLDTARGRIYWTDIGTKKIQRANLDGTYVEDLVTSEVKYPRGIVLDIAAEKMYWTDLFPPRIRRANLDGSRIEDVIKAEQLSADGTRDELYVDYVDPDKVSGLYDYGAEAVLRDPDILRLHLEAGKMYWTDLYKRKVLCANLDGTGVREVITGYGPRGIDLALSVPVSVLGARAETSEWSAPVKMGPAINTEYNENCPFLSREGKSLYFSSDRPGGSGNADLYVSHNVDGVWQQPKNLGAVVNSPAKDTGPMVSYDGKYLFFWSERLAPPRTMLFVSRIVDGEYQRPQPLPYFINSSVHTDDPFLTADGRTLYFQACKRSGNINKRDLWRVSFDEGEFGTPVNLGPVVNRFGRQKSPSLTADGRYLYYIYEMAGKSTGIVVSEKVRQNFTNPVEIEFPSLAQFRASARVSEVSKSGYRGRGPVKDETHDTGNIIGQQDREDRYTTASEIESRAGESDPGYPRGYIDSAKISWSGKELYFSMKDGDYDIWYAQKQRRPRPARPRRAGWIDILELIDVERDTKGGDWRREDGTLIGFAQSTLQTSYEMPAEYDVLWEFESNSTAINLLLTSPLGKRFEWMMKGWSHRLCGIRDVDCKPVNANETTTTFPLESGVRHVAEVKVRKDRFVALINGEEILNYKTDWSDVEVCTAWHPFELQGRRLGLWLNKHWTKTYRLQVRPHNTDRGASDNLIVPGTRVGQYAVGISKDDVLKRLGKPNVIFYRQEKYTLDNLPREYFMVYDDISFGVVDDLVQGVSALSPLYKFANGLGVGDSEQKIKQAFGDNYHFKETKGKDFLTYEDEGIQFEIHKHNRTVMEISVFRKTSQRPADPRRVSPTRPKRLEPGPVEYRRLDVGENSGPRRSVGASIDAEQQRVRQLLYVLRNYTLGSLARKEHWITAIKELVEIGKPAVPELVAELNRTERDNTMRALGFTLRAIGDARAVPALIRALPRTAARGSDLGLSVHNRQLHAFMVKHDKNNGEEEYPRFSYGRAVNEITEALEKITGHSVGDEHRRGAQSDDAEQIKAVRDKRLQAAKRWEDWWSGSWQEFLTKEQLDSVVIGPREGDPVEAAGIARYGPPIPTGNQFKLGPVTEMLVPPYHLDLWDNKAYLDLDTGRLLTKFEGGRPAGDSVVSRWYEQAGVDARAVHWYSRDRSDSGYRLEGFDTYVWQIDNSRWETMEAQIRSEKPLSLGPPGRKPDFSPRNQTGNWPGYDLSDIPAAFLFTTREGSAGILQIVQADEDSEGARIRYRLVEGPGYEPQVPSGDIAVGAQPSGALLSFGPVTEMTVFRPDADANNAVDLDTGEHRTLLLTTAYPLSKAAPEMARESGADMVSVIGGGKVAQLSLAAFHMISMPVSSAAWEKMTPAELMDFLARDTVREQVTLRVRARGRAVSRARPPSGKRAEPGMVETMVRRVGQTWDDIKTGYGDDLPKSFLFKTREGGMGILQITEFVNGDRGVNIRYRMVRKEPGGSETEAGRRPQH